MAFLPKTNLQEQTIARAWLLRESVRIPAQSILARVQANWRKRWRNFYGCLRIPEFISAECGLVTRIIFFPVAPIRPSGVSIVCSLSELALMRKNSWAGKAVASVS